MAVRGSSSTLGPEGRSKCSSAISLMKPLISAMSVSKVVNPSSRLFNEELRPMLIHNLDLGISEDSLSG